MADFLTSTHRTKWIFAAEDIKEKHKVANQRARQALERYGSSRVYVPIDGSFSYDVEHQIDTKDENGENHSKSKQLKAEENRVSAEELGTGIEQDHHVILNNEMLALLSLGFDLIVFAPYRALEGFINDYDEIFCSSKRSAARSGTR